MIGPLEREHFQSQRFRSKLTEAVAVVSLALHQSRQSYIAFSGGKDSVALAGLVHATDPDIPLVWSDDELEMPEHIEYMRMLEGVAQGQLVITLGWATHAGWFRPWADRPFWREPSKHAVHIHKPVDDWMAAQGFDLTFTGLRMDEHRKRRDWLASQGPIYTVKSGCGRRCCPLWDWTADDVWALIVGWGLAYSPVYDRYEEIGIPRVAQRVGPLPLEPRGHLEQGWPDLLARLEARYGQHWDD